VTFALGTTAGTSTSGGHTTVTTGGLNLNSLLTAINGSTLGITAAIDSLGTGIQLSTAADGTSISVTGANNISDNYGTQFTTPASGSTDQGAQYQGGLLTLDNGGKMSTDAGTLAGTLTLTSDTAANVGGYTATFVMGQATDSQINATTWGLKTADSNIAGLEAAINGTDESGANGVFVGAGAGVAAALDVTASTDTASGGIFVQSLNDNDSALSAVTTALTDNAAGAAAATTGGHNAGPADIVISNTGSSNLAGDTVTGDIVVSNTGTGSNENTTFTMGGTGGATGYGTQNVSVGGTTLNSLMTAIDNAGLSLSATISNGALSIASQDAGSTITAASALVDQYTINPATVNSGGNAPGQATQAVATLGTGVANGTDNLTSSNAVTGAVVITNNNVTDTFTMGTNAGSTNGYTFTTGSETLGGLAQAIDSASNLRLSATVANGVLNLQASATDTSITIGTDSLAATVSEGTNLSGTPGSATSGGSHSTATFTLGAGSLTTLSSNDVLVGSIAVTEAGVNGGNAVNFTMGATAAYAAANNTASQINVVGSTLSDLEGAMQSALGVDTQYANGSLVLSTPNNASIVITGTGSLQDFGAAPTQSSATLGTFASEGNSVSGMISFKDGNDGGALQTYSFTNQSITNLVNAINTTADIGVTASYAPSNGANPGGYGNLVLTSNTYGTDGNITDATLTSITDTTAAATVSYVGANAYNTGISNSNALGTALYDKSSGQSNPNGSGTSSFVANATGGSGIATISYSDGAGVSLQATDLSNQTDAEGSLNSLNSAITAVAAQDGYIGAQINTLNAVSQVLSTQQENVQAAQNAVQATDYASATSNMSKYEILSQTGIAALAQANSIQQEVTKLLQ
jgi:flagellin